MKKARLGIVRPGENSSSTGADLEYSPGGRNSVYILILLCLTYAFDYTDRMVVASLLPFIKQDWGLSDRLLGSLTGIVSLFIALFVIPLSLVVDRWSRRKMISIMVLFWSLATILCAFAGNYRQLLVARALTGLGEAGYAPAAVAVIAASFTREKRAMVTGIWDAFAPLGAALGFVVGGYIGMHYGWRHAFGLVGIPGIILALLYWFTRDYRTAPLYGNTQGSFSAYGIRKSISGLFGIPTLWFVYFAFAMNIALTTPMLTWFPSYLHRYRGIDTQKAGSLTALITMLLLIGAPLGGYIADRWMTRRINARLLFSGVTSLSASVFLGMAFLFQSTVFFIPSMIVFGILSVAFLAPAAAVIQDVVHPGLRALAYGLCVVCQHIFGASWTPMFVGELSDRMGLDKALATTSVFGLIAAVLFFIGSRYYAKDQAVVSNIVLLSE